MQCDLERIERSGTAHAPAQYWALSAVDPCQTLKLVIVMGLEVLLVPISGIIRNVSSTLQMSGPVGGNPWFALY